ncbi:hypothetical protein R1sor_018189 [Riccia sorocarpa]|uniref:Inhibitor I9 domain-containing protein n=1 Tax=Riccia sorocarpa TaxID=122646 RepID=A0ABD3ID31_9MARC
MVSCSNLLVVLTIVVSVSVAVLAEGEAEVHIVHIEKGETPLEEVEGKHLEVLASVCGGSHEKAKDLIIYHYKHGMRGFAAKLTPEQVRELESKPGVLGVNKQGVAHTTGGATTGMKTANV